MVESPMFRLNNAVLFARIEEIKKNPPPEIIAYKAEHPEFRAVNCALIAAFVGLSESTLKNLKLGKITDSNCSTIWMICTKLGIDPRDVFGMHKPAACDPESCSSRAQAQLGEKMQYIAGLEAQYKDADSRLVNLRTVIKEQSEELGAARAKVEGLKMLIDEKDGCIARRNAGIRLRNRIIIATAIVWVLIIVADLLLAQYGWFRFGPIK